LSPHYRTGSGSAALNEVSDSYEFTSLDIEVSDVQRVVFDKLASRLYRIAH
jgi:hypothetical protein